MKAGALLTIAKTFGSVALRRARRGPRRPEWSLVFEAIVEQAKTQRRQTEHMPIPAQRRIWDAMSPPNGVARRVVISKVESAPVPSFWCVPRSLSSTAPVVLFLHGGAFGFGSLRTHGEFASRVALASGARVFFPEYRLAPEHPFPAAIEDVMLTYEHLLRTEDPSRVVVLGDSAGGNLTASLLLRARDRGLPLPAGGVLVCPWVDVAESNDDPDPDDWVTGAWGDMFREAYLGGRPADDPHVSPHYAELRGVPPLLVQVGGAEILVDQVTRFVERARLASVDVAFEVTPGMTHDWHMFAGLYPPALEAIDSIARFVRKRTRARASLDLGEDRC
jgi:monoterpene epsilon-lactone hydrolase